MATEEEEVEVAAEEAEEARVTTAGGHPEGATTNPEGATTIAGPVGGLVTGPALSEVMLAVKLAVEAEVVGKPEVPGIAVGVATAGVTAEVGVATVEAVGVAVMTAVGEVGVAVFALSSPLAPLICDFAWRSPRRCARAGCGPRTTRATRARWRRPAGRRRTLVLVRAARARRCRPRAG